MIYQFNHWNCFGFPCSNEWCQTDSNMSIDLQLTLSSPVSSSLSSLSSLSTTYIIILLHLSLYTASFPLVKRCETWCFTMVFHTIPEANAVLEGFLKLRQYLHKASRKMLYIDPQLSPLGTAMHGLGDMELFWWNDGNIWDFEEKHWLMLGIMGIQWE